MVWVWPSVFVWAPWVVVCSMQCGGAMWMVSDSEKNEHTWPNLMTCPSPMP